MLNSTCSIKSWAGLEIVSCDVGIDLTAPGSSATTPVGSVMISDTFISECPIAVKTYHFSSTTVETGTTVLTFNNVKFEQCDEFIAFPDGSYLAKDVSNLTLPFFQLGDLISNATSDGFFSVNILRPAILTDSSGNYFRRP